MKIYNKLKIFNDPIYGFISIPNDFLLTLIDHPYFQRLRRISQMGLSHLVYPGAHHNRFQHALGCLHLMQKAVRILRYKGTLISNNEELGLYIAILLHDIGHGPFSHALEHSIINEVSHEQISLQIMNELNDEFNGKLSLAIEIFQERYPRKFFTQLISSHLDIDRSDYLTRDSFYTGVAEGNINSERLISMMTVVDDELVIEEKGIYSVEKFLLARRLMYWQVYLHKTGIVAETMLTNILKRARELTIKGIDCKVYNQLDYFLKTEFNHKTFKKKQLDKFLNLDDSDVYSAIKKWANHSDAVLKRLSEMIINRKLLKIKFVDEIDDKFINSKKEKLKISTNTDDEFLDYFVFHSEIAHNSYTNKESIKILLKDRSLIKFENLSNLFKIKELQEQEIKKYIVYPSSSF